MSEYLCARSIMNFTLHISQRSNSFGTIIILLNLKNVTIYFCIGWNQPRKFTTAQSFEIDSSWSTLLYNALVEIDLWRSPTMLSCNKALYSGELCVREGHTFRKTNSSAIGRIFVRFLLILL